MIDTEAHGALFRLVSRAVFRIPGRPAAKMAAFSHVEYGSGLDMLEATVRTPHRKLRHLYYRHAMDELEHSRLFRNRARELTRSDGTLAELDDAELVHERGIRSKEPLFDQLEETEFLAFVWLHEREGAKQFEVYADLMKDDAASAAMFDQIFKDERFHIAYSRKELDLLEEADGAARVRSAVWKIRRQGWWQAWLRIGRELGNLMAGLWLTLIYALVVGPFAILARWMEQPATGFVPAPETRAVIAGRASEAG